MPVGMRQIGTTGRAVAADALIFPHDRFCRSGLRRRGRDREGQPRIPTLGAVLRAELLEAFQVDVTLHVADRENVADLRADAGDARTKTVEPGRHTRIVGDLLEVIADHTDMELLGEE